ncbi:hypothetical protein PRK78_005589 [Emydomyces testavorans]|uniref:NB-ARC domain-containing protein n=1 Tax=Emydomyces testavorans TaxID=2070801 RepID=A0AAF0IMR3_9EURO|nr:hypothetical protein PRK78_005589 [Emydomyces testavorans]
MDTIELWTDIICSSRRSCNEHTLETEWPSIREKVYNIAKRIETSSQEIKEKAEALSFRGKIEPRDLMKQFSYLHMTRISTDESTPEDVKFPIHNIPYHRNLHFFGREAVLRAVHDTLDDGSKSPGFRSIVIWGMGGVGKTQIALQYAHDRIAGGCQAVFWVNTETSMEVIRSFTQIAQLLKLTISETDENHQQDKVAIMNWLQKTTVDWLLIFDNVEGFQILREYWPVASRGSVLITSRSDMISGEFAGRSLEIPVFESLEGCKFLLQTVQRKAYSDEELRAAEQLTQELGGLALAINMMGMYIRQSRVNISRFLEIYHDNIKRYHESFPGKRPSVWYRHSLATAWDTAFDALNDQASVLFGILCLLSPDDIPEDLFCVTNPEILPLPLRFCDLCDFTELLTNAAWSLLEIGSWSDFSDLIQTALDTCEEKDSILYAHLCCSAAVVHMEKAHTAKARPYFEKCLQIRKALLPEYHEEIANDCNNYANLLIQESRAPDVLAEAEQLYLRAMEIDAQVDANKPEGKKNELLYIKCFGLGTVYAAQNRYQEAIDMIEKGRFYAIRALGIGGHWDASASYQIGNVYYAKGDWKVARTHFERALELFSKENPLHPTTSASQLKLARIAIKQQRYENAIELLAQTKVICRFYEVLKGDQGDTARVLRALAEAYEGLGRHEEAEEHRIQAEDIRKQIQGERFNELPDCEQSYNLLVYQTFW